MRFIQLIEEKPLRLFLLYFGVAASIALGVQFFALPYVFPQWHWGHGLLIPPGDWVGFHIMASENAREVHEKGWAALKLYPFGGAPITVMTVIYILTWCEPWTLIPLQAGLHAGSALTLFYIARTFSTSARGAFFSTLPFFLFPSAMLWYTQIHRDGYVTFGLFLMIFGWMRLLTPATWRGSWLKIVGYLVSAYVGVLFLWLGRPYVLEVLRLLAMGLALAFSLVAVFKGIRGELPWGRVIAAPLVLTLLLAGFLPLERKYFGETHLDAPSASFTEGKARIEPEVSKKQVGQPSRAWERSAWLPDRWDLRFYVLYCVRNGFRNTHPEAPTTVDADVGLYSAAEFVSYVPRALQIAFLAPFPKTWGGQGSKGPSKLIRKITGAEMAVVYLGLLSFLWTVGTFWRRSELWVSIVFCVPMITLYGLIVTNVGTMYRIRYGFLMMLVTIGLAGLPRLYEAVRSRLPSRSLVSPVHA